MCCLFYLLKRNRKQCSTIFVIGPIVCPEWSVESFCPSLPPAPFAMGGARSNSMVLRAIPAWSDGRGSSVVPKPLLGASNVVPLTGGPADPQQAFGRARCVKSYILCSFQSFVLKLFYLPFFFLNFVFTIDAFECFSGSIQQELPISFMLAEK